MSRPTCLVPALAALTFALAGFNSCAVITVNTPDAMTLYAAGSIDVDIRLPAASDTGTLVVNLDDGASVTSVLGSLTVQGTEVTGTLVAPATGSYTLHVQVTLTTGSVFGTSRTFATLALANPEHCEALNAASCMLPFPSDFFLVDDFSRPAGFNSKRMLIDASALPSVVGPALDPAPYGALDGFSPTAAILMHFPAAAALNLLAPNFPRLSFSGPVQSPPYTGLRTIDDKSLSTTSASILIDALSGERILHFLERDQRAAGNPARQTLIMRPAIALTPGRRYIVAVRDLVDTTLTPVAAEAPFVALRDARPTTIDAIENRRAHFEADIFPQLASAGIDRNGLLLAFDFTVQSEAALTSAVLSMRDQSYAWLGAGNAAFTVDSVVENDCTVPGTVVWRLVRGTFEVPLFLTADPEANINSLGVLNDPNSDGIPDPNGVTNPLYSMSLPCSALDPVPPTAHSIVLGHGLFGTGDQMVVDFGDFLDGTYIAGATDWRGLSSADLDWVVNSIVGFGSSKLNNFPALPDRLKQGQINTQVLTRMMKHGLFNDHPCFEIRSPLPANCMTAGPDPLAVGVFPGSPSNDVEMFYFGVSLGGIMGTWFAALTPDVERFNVDVPGFNFGMLLQRSTQFSNFDLLLNGIGLTDPMNKLFGLALIHELWVSGEPAGYVKSLADEIASNTKKLLVTVAWLDKQVSNQVTEIMVRSLGIPNHEGSILQGLEGIPDVSGPQDSAMVIYDTGSFDLWNAAHVPHIPPVFNTIPTSVCDPHGFPRISIPASLDQVTVFLQPGGEIVNFCTGVCDGVGVNDQPLGGPCDPLNP